MYKFVNGLPHILGFVFIWDKRQENQNVKFTNDKPKRKLNKRKKKKPKNQLKIQFNDIFDIPYLCVCMATKNCINFKLYYKISEGKQ